MGNKKENEKKAIEKDKIDTLSILDEEDSNDGKEQTLLLAAKEGELNIIKWLAEKKWNGSCEKQRSCCSGYGK